MQHRSSSRATGWRSTATAAAARFPRQALCLALAGAGLSAPVLAQDAAPVGDGLKLDQVVLTGTSTQVSKMKQSLSVSSVDAEQMGKIGATNAAELLRSVPGLRS